MRPTLLVLVAEFLALGYSSDSPSLPTAPAESKNVSFVVYVEDSKDDSKFLKGNDIVLNCTVEGKPRTLKIVGHNLMISFNESSGKPFVVHKLTGAQCIAMGSYMCEVDDFQAKEKSFGLYDCGPQLCPGDEVNRTVFVYPGQPLRIGLCVLAFPGLYENMRINGVNIRKKDLSQRWSWDYQNSSFTYHLELAHNSALEPELGDLPLQIFSAIGEQYVLEQFMTLRAPGPPECPLEVTVADQGIHYVTLSWTPGSDEGYPQRFHAFFSHDNITWYRYDVAREQRSANLTGLLRNSSYSFSVVSSNKLRREIDAFTCDVVQSSTLMDFRGSTLALASSKEDGNEPGKRLPLMFLIFGLGAVSVGVVWLTVAVLRLRSRKIRRRAHSSENSSVIPEISQSSGAPLVKDIESSLSSSERESFTD